MQIRQIYVADTNHKTILVSDFEKEVLSTKLFNRLHHISQNSTAYLTFPSNRTKRLEHSIGTMKLCGDIFYNAICNSSEDVISTLFKDIKALIEKKIITEEILRYADKYRPMLGDQSLKRKGEQLIKELSEYHLHNIFYNRCIPQNLIENQRNLYIITYQSIRLCGLLHDIGHPPFSHITEKAMNNVLKYLKTKAPNTLTAREKDYVSILSEYAQNSEELQLHEKMGIKMSEKLFSQIFSSIHDNNKLSFHEKYFKILVMELTKLIFQEEGNILKTLHSIIAGTIDGDRLDYVNRDIRNSGIDNGKIESDRLIGSCKFCFAPPKKKKNSIKILYEAKTINTIEDFFMKRWYLYKNIIHHHRVLKTDTILQNSLEFIIQDYLKKDDASTNMKNGILPNDISGLWQAIKFAYSNEEYFDSLIQWDDNWLITILKNHYFRDYYNQSGSISYMLEEFLSNKKNYYSVIKNNNDFYDFSHTFDSIVDISRIKDKVKKEEYEQMDGKYSKDNKNRGLCVMVAYLDSVLDKKIDIKLMMADFIHSEYNNMIEDHFVVIKNIKHGLNPEPWIYNGDEIFNLRYFSNIRSILEVENGNYPYFYVYLKLYQEDQMNDKFKKNFLKKFAKYLGNKVNELIEEKEEII